MGWLAASLSQFVKPLKLADFLPYRLSVLANRVSSQLASAYSTRFDISIAEWRVIAVLGECAAVSADFVCAKTEMDKVTVSRAVAKLLKKRYVTRRFTRHDRRQSQLSLAAAGRALYADIVPLARRYEAALIVNLSTAARRELDDALAQLQEQVVALRQRGF